MASAGGDTAVPAILVPAPCPFNAYAMRMINTLSSGTTVYLHNPTGSNHLPPSPDGNIDRDGNTVPFSVTYSIISGCLLIGTATLEFHAKALRYLSYKYGKMPFDDSRFNDKWVCWEIEPSVGSGPSIEDLEAQVEAHLEAQAEIARGK